MRPLREGVQHHVTKKQGRVTEVHVYKNITIGSPDASRCGLVWTVYFDASGRNWEKSKRLIYGSLVLISFDNFASNRGMIVATVVDNDMRRDGEIMVQLHLGDLNPRLEYTMLESSAYFEPYKHVLTQIQNPFFRNIPFQDYLVGRTVNRQRSLLSRSNHAKYLRNQLPLYDLSALMKQGYEKLGEKINVTNGRWDNEEYMALNGSQLKAVKAALTHELAVIQGPPGTGKTYIALKVVQCLLDNTRYWFGADSKLGCPILVICYTNHALDQFLEGIVKAVPEKIVRVGSRSKSEILKPFNLSLMRAEWGKKRKFTSETARLRNVYMAEYRKLSENIENIADRIKWGAAHVLRKDAKF